jgi:hypothetical protein
MLPSYHGFFHDAEELVVLEIIRTMGRLLKLKLIPKSSLLGDKGGSALLDQLLPFLLHPNTWIREETLNFILTLSDHQNVAILNKAEVFCIVRKKLKDYLQAPESCH